MGVETWHDAVYIISAVVGWFYSLMWSAAFLRPEFEIQSGVLAGGMLVVGVLLAVAGTYAYTMSDRRVSSSAS